MHCAQKTDNARKGIKTYHLTRMEQRYEKTQKTDNARKGGGDQD